MNNYQQRKLNTYQAELAFMLENAADFPANSVGAKTMTALSDVIGQILSLSGEQRSNVTRQQVSIKGDRLQQLIELLQKMNRAAIAMADEIDGIENLFRMPRKRATEVWLSTARTFHTDSAAYENEFKDYDLPADFRADILNLIHEIQAASNKADTAGANRAGATGGLADAFKTAGKLSNKLNAVVLNKYSNNPQKLAAWAVASHLESPPRAREEAKAPNA
jgi:hypothetical protein